MKSFRVAVQYVHSTAPKRKSAGRRGCLRIRSFIHESAGAPSDLFPDKRKRIMSKIFRNVPWLTQEKMSPFGWLHWCLVLAASEGLKETAAKRRSTEVPLKLGARLEPASLFCAKRRSE